MLLLPVHDSVAIRAEDPTLGDLSGNTTLTPVAAHCACYLALFGARVQVVEVQDAPIVHTAASTCLPNLLRLQERAQALAALGILSDEVVNRLGPLSPVFTRVGAHVRFSLVMMSHVAIVVLDAPSLFVSCHAPSLLRMAPMYSLVS
jgi:hypothetical protein